MKQNSETKFFLLFSNTYFPRKRVEQEKLKENVLQNLKNIKIPGITGNISKNKRLKNIKIESRVEDYYDWSILAYLTLGIFGDKYVKKSREVFDYYVEVDVSGLNKSQVTCIGFWFDGYCSGRYSGQNDKIYPV